MGCWKKKILLVLSVLMILSVNSVSLADYNTIYGVNDEFTARRLSKMQGPWYDENGNAVLNFQGNTLNGCPIVGLYHIAGGGGDFGCVIRIIEANGYRDLPIDCENLGSAYHSHIILDRTKDNGKDAKLLSTTPDAQYYESVGGIGIDTPEKFVVEKYGYPDQIVPSKFSPLDPSTEEWLYNKLGLVLTIRYHKVWVITIQKDGDRHFDRTGFNCNNTLYEFQAAYNFQDHFGNKKIPEAGHNEGFTVAEGEYMWFNDYPNSITLATYSN